MSIIGELFNIKPEPWTEQANCIGTDPEAFHPEKGGSTREAKTVCSRCVVRAQCLEFALRNGERFGIFGGFSERERRRIARGERVEFHIERNHTPAQLICGWCRQPFTGSSSTVYCCSEHRRAAQLARKGAA